MRLAGGGGSLLDPVGFGLGKSGTLALDLAFAIAFGLSLAGGETGSDFCTLAGGSAAGGGLTAGAFGPGIDFGTGMSFGTGGALEMSGAIVGGIIAGCGCGTFGPTGGGGMRGTDFALCAG